ncbi:MAG: ferredoxin [Eubacteriales bacterium]
MKAYVDKDLCIGCGLCPNICPEVFEYGLEDAATVIVDKVPADAEDTAKEAEESCPSSAIRVE